MISIVERMEELLGSLEEKTDAKRTAQVAKWRKEGEKHSQASHKAMHQGIADRKHAKRMGAVKDALRPGLKGLSRYLNK